MKGLIVCRTGMGSSMMLKIKAQKIIDKNKWNIELEHDVLSSLGSYRGIDFVLTMNDLTQEISDMGFKAYGVKDLMDSVEMENILRLIMDEVK